jgi:hypothetical protein
VWRLLALAVVVLLAGSASAAAPPRDLTIQFRLHFTVQNAADGSLAGTFQATGAVTGSGRVEERYILSLPRRRGRQPVETVTGISTLPNVKGTLPVSYTGIVSSASPTLTVTEGTWKIRDATGSFTGLRGTGRLSAIVDLAKRTMVKRYDGAVT